MRYAPGPWTYVPATEDNWAYILSQGTRIIACVDSVDAEDRATGKLIAAAPELLEALEDLVDACESASGSMDYNYGEFDLEAAREAIKKARDI